MKNECSIVCDLLPLYAEDMVSEDTAEFVKEHLGNCPTCRAELEKLRKPVQPVAAQHVPDIDAEPLKRLKKALLMEKVQAILCTAAVLLALMLSGLSFLTAGILRLFAGTGYGNSGSKRRSNYLFQQ